MTEKIRIPEVQLESPVTQIQGGMAGYSGGGPIDVYTKTQAGNVEVMRALENFVKATSNALYEGEKVDVEEARLRAYAHVAQDITTTEDTGDPYKDNRIFKQAFANARSRKLGFDASENLKLKAQDFIVKAMGDFKFEDPEASAASMTEGLKAYDAEMASEYGAEVFGNENFQKVYGQARSQIQALYLQAVQKESIRQQSSVGSGLMDEQLNRFLLKPGPLEVKDLKEILSMKEIKALSLSGPHKEGLLITQIEDKILETINNPKAPHAAKLSAFSMSFMFEEKNFGRNKQSLEKLHPDLVEGAQKRIKSAWEAYENSLENVEKIKLTKAEEDFQKKVINGIELKGEDYDTMKEIMELKDTAGRSFSDYFTGGEWRTFLNWVRPLLPKTKNDEATIMKANIATTHDHYGLYQLFPTHDSRFRFAKEHYEIFKMWQDKVRALDATRDQSADKSRDARQEQMTINKIAQIRDKGKTASEVLDRSTLQFLKLGQVNQIRGAHDAEVAKTKAEMVEDTGSRKTNLHSQVLSAISLQDFYAIPRSGLVKYPDIYKKYQDRVKAKLTEIQKTATNADKAAGLKLYKVKLRAIRDGKPEKDVFSEGVYDNLSVDQARNLWAEIDKREAKARSVTVYDQGQEDRISSQTAEGIELEIFTEIYSGKADYGDIFTTERAEQFKAAGKVSRFRELRGEWKRHQDDLSQAKERVATQFQAELKAELEIYRNIENLEEKAAKEALVLLKSKAHERMITKVFSGKYNELQLFGTDKNPDSAIITIAGKTYQVNDLLTPEQIKALRKEHRTIRDRFAEEGKKRQEKLEKEEQEHNAETVRIYKFGIYSMIDQDTGTRADIFNIDKRNDFLLKGGTAEDWVKMMDRYDKKQDAEAEGIEKLDKEIQAEIDALAKTDLEKKQTKLLREARKNIKKGGVKMVDIFTDEVEETLNDQQWVSLFDRLNTKQKEELGERAESQKTAGIFTFRNLMSMADKGVPIELMETWMDKKNPDGTMLLSEPQYNTLRARLDTRIETELAIEQANLVDVTRKNIRDAISEGNDFRELVAPDGRPYRSIIGADNWDNYVTLWENREFKVRDNYQDYQLLAEDVYGGDIKSLEDIRELRNEIFGEMAISAQNREGLPKGLGLEMQKHLDVLQNNLTKGLGSPLTSSDVIKEAMNHINDIYRVDDKMSLNVQARSAVYRQRAMVRANFVRQLHIWLATKEKAPEELEYANWVNNVKGENPTANIGGIRQRAEKAFPEFGKKNLDIGKAEENLEIYRNNPPRLLKDRITYNIPNDTYLYVQSQMGTQEILMMNGMLKTAINQGSAFWPEGL